MIGSDTVDAAAYIIDTSNITTTIGGAMTTSRRGRPRKHNSLRLYFLGMFLAINDRGSATVVDIHKVLTHDISLDDQRKQGVLVEGRKGWQPVTYTQLADVSELIRDRLGYGPSIDGLTDDMRAERLAVINKAVNDLMDVFDLGWTSTTYAVDATGLWSWAIGKGKPDRANDDDLDEHPVAYEPLDPADLTQPTSIIVGPDGEQIEVTDTTINDCQSADPDATWMGKTSKSGKTEMFHGYMEHTFVLVSDHTTTDKGTPYPAEPLLIRRLEVTTANEDVVNVTLRLLDSLGDKIDVMAVDRHYSYKAYDRWQKELIRRRVRQHLDLRSTDQGFTEFSKMRWAAGCAHCPATPDKLGNLAAPATNASKVKVKAFQDAIELRQTYAMRIVNPLDDTGAMRLQCPAVAGTVGCSLRPGTLEVAIEFGNMPIVEDPPMDDGAGLPAVCTQQTVKVRPPAKIAKLHQQHYWGSKKWRREYNKRTYVESSYGTRKNRSSENLTRGITRSVGLPRVNLVSAMSAASYNYRMLRNWHEATKLGDTSHPLLRPIRKPLGFILHYEDEATADAA